MKRLEAKVSDDLLKKIDFIAEREAVTREVVIRLFLEAAVENPLFHASIKWPHPKKALDKYMERAAGEKIASASAPKPPPQRGKKRPVGARRGQPRSH